MKKEFENIQHNKVNAIYFIITDISYRRPHLHFDTEIAYVLSGTGVVTTEETEYPIREGQAIIFNSCQTHNFSSKDSFRLLIMQFGTNAFAPFYPPLDHIRFDSQPFTLTRDDKFLINLLKCATSYFQEADYLPLLTCGLALLSLYELLKIAKFYHLNQSQQNKLMDLQERIERISSYIQENYRETISLSDLATRENFSRTYFSHFFKNNFGISFQEYVDNIRCEHGHRLLLGTNENLLNITNACGFADIRTFNNAFKKRYNSTPKVFRENHEKENIPENTNRMTDGVDHQRTYDSKESSQILKEYMESNFLTNQ